MGCSSSSSQKTIKMAMWENDNINMQLNRWTSRQIALLKNAYKASIISPSHKLKMDKKSFINCFSKLSLFPKVVQDVLFKMFDQDKSGDIDFREFCYSTSLICLSSIQDQHKFVFDMFDLNENSYLSITETGRLLKCVLLLEKSEPDTGGTAGVTQDLTKGEKSWIDNELKEVHRENPKLELSDFLLKFAPNYLNVYNFTDIFQVTPSSIGESQIISNILNLTEQKNGDVWYPVSFKWWEMWNIYVNQSEDSIDYYDYMESIKELQRPIADAESPRTAKSMDERRLGKGFKYSHTFKVYGSSNTMTNAKHKGNNRLRMGPTENSLLEDGELGSQLMAQPHQAHQAFPKQRASVEYHHMFSSLRHISNLVGDRPSEIDNSDLEGEHKGEVKRMLYHKRDYILLPEEAYNKMLSWYGGGPSFPRKVIMCGKSPTIELYPPRVFICLSDATGRPITTSAKSAFVSNLEIMKGVIDIIKEKFQITDAETRLWFKEAGSDFKLLTQMEESMEEIGGKTGDAFMLEMKFNKIYPRDEQEEEERPWNSFEVGDLVDLLDFKNTKQWKVARIVKVEAKSLKLHLESEHYKNDLTIARNSVYLAKHGTKTLESHLRTVMSTDLTTGKIPPSICGLQNLGNTCYMNAVLQCLLTTPLLRPFFLGGNFNLHINKKNPEGSQGKIAQEFGRLVMRMERGNEVTITPSELKKVTAKYIPQFMGFEQHDAQEFLGMFLDKLSEDMNKVTKEEILSPGKKVTVGNTRGSPIKGSPEVKGSGDRGSGDRGSGDRERESNRDKDKDYNRESNKDKDYKRERDYKNHSNTEAQAGGGRTTEQIRSNLNSQFQNVPVQESGSDEDIDPAKTVPVLPKNILLPMGEKEESKAATMGIGGHADTDDYLNLPKSITKQSLDEWKKQEVDHSSIINDLFAGQICTTIQCPQCNNTHHKFDKFFSLSLPVPVDQTITYKINFVGRCSLYEYPMIMKYGININKHGTWGDLLGGCEVAMNLHRSKLHFIEIYNGKIYRAFNPDELVKLKKLGMRNNTELYAYEVLQEQSDIQQIVPYIKYDYKNKYQGQIHGDFKLGDVVDVYVDDKWEIGRIVDYFNSTEQGHKKKYVKIFLSRKLKKRTAYEYIELGSGYLAPLGSHTTDSDTILLWNVIHRSKKSSSRRGSSTYYQIFGTPFVIAIGTWFTWKQVFDEICTQALRFAKHRKEVAISAELVNLSEWVANVETEEGIGGISQGALKLAIFQPSEHTMKHQSTISGSTAKSQTPERYENSQKIHHGSSPNTALPTPTNNPSFGYGDKGSPPKKPTMSRQADPPTDFDNKSLPFVIKILEESTNHCAICSNKSADRYAKNSRTNTIICSGGCQIPRNKHCINDIVQFFGRVNVYIDWTDPNQYKDILLKNHSSLMKVQEETKNRKKGFTLDKCFELFTKEEELDSYNCETCKSKVKAKVTTSLSRLPDLMILHLKRFSYEDNFMEKLEHYISFPLDEMTFQKWVIPELRSRYSDEYELYGVCNHLIYSTVGGHYTAAIRHRQEEGEEVKELMKTQRMCSWFFIDDSHVSHEEQSSILSKNAYLLFYRKKQLSASNIVNMTFQTLKQ